MDPLSPRTCSHAVQVARAGAQCVRFGRISRISEVGTYNTSHSTAATPVNERPSVIIFGSGEPSPPMAPGIEGPHALIMRHSGRKAPVQWFYDTVPLHAEMTPGIAKATHRVLRSALSPKEGAMSPDTCMNALEAVKGTLQLRRSERIKKAVAVAKAKAEAEKAALRRPRRLVTPVNERLVTPVNTSIRLG